MSNTNLLPFVICRRCNMRFHKGRPHAAHGTKTYPDQHNGSSRERCPTPGCGRTFNHSASTEIDGATGERREIVRCWVDTAA